MAIYICAVHLSPSSRGHAGRDRTKQPDAGKAQGRLMTVYSLGNGYAILGDAGHASPELLAAT
jgi:hypothetical protein